MIEANGNKLRVEGSINELVNELSVIIFEVCNDIASNTNEEYNEVLDKVLQLANLRKLVHSGMTEDEAAKVLGLLPEEQ